MVNVKQKLEKVILTDIEETKTNLTRQRKSLKTLEKIDFKKARYEVYLFSLGSKEGQPVFIMPEELGSVEEAIKQAETEFKFKNKRNDVQANYQVYIHVGESKYLVPNEYWEKYKEKTK